MCVATAPESFASKRSKYPDAGSSTCTRSKCIVTFLNVASSLGAAARSYIKWREPDWAAAGCIFSLLSFSIRPPDPINQLDTIYLRAVIRSAHADARFDEYIATQLISLMQLQPSQVG